MTYEHDLAFVNDNNEKFIDDLKNERLILQHDAISTRELTILSGCERIDYVYYKTLCYLRKESFLNECLLFCAYVQNTMLLQHVCRSAACFRSDSNLDTK